MSTQQIFEQENWTVEVPRFKVNPGCLNGTQMNHHA